MMNQERIEALEGTEGWTWEEEDPFDNNLQEWIIQYQKEGSYPSRYLARYSEDPEEKRAAQWQSRMRQTYKAHMNGLKTTMVEKLETRFEALETRFRDSVGEKFDFDVSELDYQNKIASLETQLKESTNKVDNLLHSKIAVSFETRLKESNNEVDTMKLHWKIESLEMQLKERFDNLGSLASQLSIVECKDPMLMNFIKQKTQNNKFEKLGSSDYNDYKTSLEAQIKKILNELGRINIMQPLYERHLRAIPLMVEDGLITEMEVPIQEEEFKHKIWLNACLKGALDTEFMSLDKQLQELNSRSTARTI